MFILDTLLWCLLFYARFSIVAPLTKKPIIIDFSEETQEEVISPSKTTASSSPGNKLRNIGKKLDLSHSTSNNLRKKRDNYAKSSRSHRV
ncbi:MAG: hypothetical protein ACMUEL_09305 [Flavobacteriales bacterium Tduv]